MLHHNKGLQNIDGLSPAYGIIQKILKPPKGHRHSHQESHNHPFIGPFIIKQIPG